MKYNRDRLLKDMLTGQHLGTCSSTYVITTRYTGANACTASTDDCAECWREALDKILIPSEV